MRTLTAMALISLSTAAIAETCHLEKNCPEKSDCQHSTLEIEFVGSPPNDVRSDFGTFTVTSIAKAGETTSKIQMADGKEYKVVTTSDLLVATNRTENGTAVMYIAKPAPNELVVTLVEVPMRYQEYTDFQNSRLVFSGECKTAF